MHRHQALVRFLLLYAALYAAFGVQSPYLPTLLADRGLGPEAVGLLLAGGGIVRLIAGPVAGRVADRLDAPKPVLIFCALLAALAGLLYPTAEGMLPLLLIVLLQTASLAPLAPLTDSLALGAAAPRPKAGPFAYGWVRGAGSAAFILGSVLSGLAVARSGTHIIVWLAASLLAATAIATWFVTKLPPPASVPEPASGSGGIATLLRLALFRRLVLVVALILGSHALHDGFAMIRWRDSGIGADSAGLLWAESVAAEVLVFLVIGGRLLAWLGPAGAAMLAACAGLLRWTVMGATAWVPALILIQPLHGLTFALLHLSAMGLMAEIVPPPLAATALALYGTVGIGAASALLMLASGPLYAGLGAHAFWVMAGLCALALPFTATLRPPRKISRGAAGLPA